MSKAKWIAANAAFALVLSAAPQSSDAPGVTVDLNGASLIHRAPVTISPGIRSKGVRGTVVVEVTLDAAGEVADARVLSGPDQLRKAVLESVLQWHFAHEPSGTHRQVTVTFDPPAPVAPKAAAIPRLLPAPLSDAKAQERWNAMEAARLRAASVQRTVKSVSVTGISDSARAELLGMLPVHQGDSLDLAGTQRLIKAVKEFDEHLIVSFPQAGSETEVAVQIAAPNSKPESSINPQRIRVGGNVQQANLVSQLHPIYPPEAKQQRIQGKVQLAAIIGKDGTVMQLDVVSGQPSLAAAALDAVRQWIYKPTLLNGDPVEVSTNIDVNFTLSQ
jgi:TonB family protein